MKNLSNLGSKTDPKWGPSGSGETIDLGLHFVNLLEPCWAQSHKKIDLSDSKSPKGLTTLLDGFLHRLLIDFGPILELFLEGVLDTFWGSSTRARS